jgi:hypothetical protein
MENERKKKIWLWLVVVLTAMLVIVSVGMLKFALSVSAGNVFLDLMRNGTTEAIARQEAYRVGHITQVLYFLGVPFTGYMILNLLIAYVLGIRVRDRAIPLWKSLAAICLFGGIFFAASVAMWNKQPLAGVIVGALMLWLGIFALLAMLIGVVKFGYKVRQKVKAQNV